MTADGEAPGVFKTLTQEQCHELLAVGVIGRVAFNGSQGITLLPLNYLQLDGAIYCRVSADSVLGELAHDIGEIAFQVDQQEDLYRKAWSITVNGTAAEVTDLDTLANLRAHRQLQPWAIGKREVFIRMTIVRIAGRRVVRYAR